MSEPGIETTPCLNCGAALTDAYCAKCGQKRTHTDLSLREFLHDATEELAHWEGKVPTTLKSLFLEPGRLTRDFLAGRRARWLPPLRVYLICSLAFFVSKPLAEAVTHRASREIAKITLTNPNGSATLTPEAREAIAQSLPARLFGSDRIERAASNSAQLNRAIGGAYPKAMFVLLPLFAFLTSVAWRRTLPRYPAHLYLALHLHAAAFGALAVATVLSSLIPSDTVDIVVGAAGLGYIVWYALAAVRSVFGDSWGLTIAKSAAVTVVYGVCLFLVSLGMLAYALATM